MINTTLDSKNSPKERRNVLAQELQNRNLDCAIISNPKHIFYFTGFPTNLNMYFTLMKGPRSTSFLCIGKNGEGFLLLGKSEVSNPWVKGSKASATKRVFDGEVSTYEDYKLDERMITYADILSIEMEDWLRNLSSKGVSFEKMGIENWHLSEAYRSSVSNVFGEAKLVGISREILSMRKTKGKDEISNLEKSTQMLDFGYKIAKANSKAGKSEVDLYREMNYEAFKKYGPFGWIIGDHVSGERSLAVGGWPTDRRFKRGDTIVLDLQTASNNYWSDLCRTFVVGKPSRKQEHALNVPIKAKERVEELLRPGTKGKEIYDAASNEISKGGYPKLVHHAGHSIGLDDQEPPWFIPNSEEELEEGVVCVVEPGIYIPSTGGIRIEDCYVITKNGHKTISKFPLGFS